MATKSQKRALEEPTDPAADKGSSEDAHRYVRRKVAEAPPAARTLRNATNSGPRVPSSKEVSLEQKEQKEANVRTARQTDAGSRKKDPVPSDTS